MGIEQWLVDFDWWIVLIIAWSLPWKAVALWRAARRSDTGWFIALLLINTLGILEMFYIFYWTRRKSAHDPRFTRI